MAGPWYPKVVDRRGAVLVDGFVAAGWYVTRARSAATLTVEAPLLRFVAARAGRDRGRGVRAAGVHRRRRPGSRGRARAVGGGGGGERLGAGAR